VIVLPRQPPAWQQWIFRLLLLICPRLRLNVRKITKPKKGAPPAWVTRDAAHRKWFETAPHRVDSFTLRFFRCLHDLIGGCTAAAPLLTVPVLILYAGHDVFIASERVAEFIEQIGSEEKESEFFAESYHLLLHDDDRLHVLARIGSWLEQRLLAMKSA
jgi:alpha-beta hydrolase superfamily lysophospholipase